MIHISGSLAFDRIMTFPGRFEEHILPEKLHFLNVSFPIERLEEKLGGTAGNIAYSLSLMHERSAIYCCAGKDFTPYGRRLASMGIDTHGIKVIEDDFTACCYITTDKSSNQISAFSPSAMKNPAFSSPALCKGDLGIAAPGNVDDMASFPAYYKEQGIAYIFDPGQQITSLSKEQLLLGIEGAYVLIGNDYEIQLIERITGLSREELLNKAEFLIITLGGKGSSIMQKGAKSYHVPAIAPNIVADPTGAGDAYRAGLLKGLSCGMGIAFSARLGAVLSSFCVEHYGTQLHSFSMQEFQARYEAAFGPMPMLK